MFRDHGLCIERGIIVIGVVVVVVVDVARHDWMSVVAVVASAAVARLGLLFQPFQKFGPHPERGLQEVDDKLLWVEADARALDQVVNPLLERARARDDVPLGPLAASVERQRLVVDDDGVVRKHCDGRGLLPGRHHRLHRRGIVVLDPLGLLMLLFPSPVVVVAVMGSLGLASSAARAASQVSGRRVGGRPDGLGGFLDFQYVLATRGGQR